MTTRLVAILGLGNPNKPGPGYDPVEYTFEGRTATRFSRTSFVPRYTTVSTGARSSVIARLTSGERVAVLPSNVYSTGS